MIPNPPFNRTETVEILSAENRRLRAQVQEFEMRTHVNWIDSEKLTYENNLLAERVRELELVLKALTDAEIEGESDVNERRG